MVELLDLAQGREVHLGLNLNQEPMKENNVEDQPTLIIKLPQAREYAQSLSNFVVEHSLEFSITSVTTCNLLWIDNLNKMLIANIDKHHHIKTIYSYFCSV